jgi:hypothetical protein
MLAFVATAAWAAPIGTPEVGISQPNYFNELHNLHGVLLAQMGLLV